MKKQPPRIRRIYTGDNLPILRSMNSDTVDLIYLDPPFNSGKQWANPIEAKGKKALASFKDTWDLDDDHADHMYQMRHDCPKAAAAIDVMGDINGVSWTAYLIYMGARLLEMRRILKPTGSIYYHCDPVMSHGVKVLMDAIFGGGGQGGKASGGNFISEIVWNYGTPSGGRVSGKKPVKSHENLLAYAKKYGKHVYYPQFLSYDEKYVKDWFRHTDEDGRKYRTRSRDGKIIRQYLDESKGVPLSNVWTDIMQLYGSAGWFPRKNDERTGYPTQKPLALMERIIKASSNEGDLVLDPFCGCATTCVAAERLKRNWIGIDLSEEAAPLVIDRLREDVESPLADPDAAVEHLQKLPKRTDLKRTDNQILKRRLYKEQHRLCNGCQEELELRNLEIDHVIDRNRGGQDEDTNLQLLCGACNREKGNRGMQYLQRKIANRMAQEYQKEMAERRLKRLNLQDDLGGGRRE